MFTRAHSGFTLIELLVAIAILAILTSIAYPNMQAFLLNIQIRTATEAVNNGMQLARGEAVRRNANIKFTLGAGSSWTVGCETAIGDTDGDGIDDCPAVIQSRSANEGSTSATLTVTPAAATGVTFNGLGRVTSNADGTDTITRVDVDVPTTLLAADRSRELRLLVSGGNIRMCSPNITTTGDARKC